MTKDSSRAASDLLFEHWVEGRVIAELPAQIRPATREDGYAIQALLEERTGRPLYGWKIAATSAAGQAHIGVDGPIAGRLLADRILPPGGTVPPGPNRMAVAEPEFAFRMGRDLAPRAAPYTVDEVLAAVSTVHPAIEIPDSRYADFAKVGVAQLLADNACAHYFTAADATAADWRSLDLASHRVTGRIEGKLEREGSGANVLGDPRMALAWLANELSGLGIVLRKGQTVTTGTCMPPIEAGAGDLVIADFGVLGVVSIRFP